jgi:hypothetical protein
MLGRRNRFQAGIADDEVRAGMRVLSTTRLH